MKFPPFPKSNRDIWDFQGGGEFMACAIVHRTDMRQLLAFRKLRLRLGEQSFRECLCEGLDVLAHADSVISPSAFLYAFIRDVAEGADARERQRP